MDSYRTLYRIRVEHDYFDGKPCTALQCRLTPQGEALKFWGGTYTGWQLTRLAVRQRAPHDALPQRIREERRPCLRVRAERCRHMD